MARTQALRRTLTGVLLAASVGTAVHAGGAAPAAAAEDCVGVVIDARLLGGGVRTGCADGDPRSGLDALTRAGFSYAFVPRQPGLVCRIDGLPECSQTTTTTYWSYWHRAPGSSTWTYSTQGAATYDPKPGSVEAWVWQDGGRVEPPDVALRTICPQAAAGAGSAIRSSTPSRTGDAISPTATPRHRSRDAAETRNGSEREARPAGEQRRRPKPSPSTSAGPADRATATASAAGGPSDPPTSAAASAVTRADRESAGDAPLLGLVLGGGLVALLGGAATWRARRRPTSSGGSP